MISEQDEIRSSMLIQDEQRSSQQSRGLTRRAKKNSTLLNSKIQSNFRHKNFFGI